MGYVASLNRILTVYNSSHRSCPVKMVFLEISQNSQETLTQVFSCEFCEISKNNFLYRTSLVAASDHKTAREQVLNARTILRDSLLHEEKLTNS